jgi:uncharacterized membrane protein YdfJ with MMPL/SSD domain
MVTALLERIVRRPGLSTAIAVLAVLGLAAFGGSAPVVLADGPADDFADSAAEHFDVSQQLADARGSSAVQVAVVTRSVIDATRVADAVEQLPGVAQVAHPAELRAAGLPDADNPLLGVDGRAGMVTVRVVDGADTAALVEAVGEATQGLDGALVGGPAAIQEAINHQVEADLAAAETFAFPLLFLVSIWVFRSLVAAFMPLLVGVATIMATFAMLAATDAFVDLSIFAINLVFALGLGLAVDYSLLVVNRVREARVVGHDPRSAVLVATRSIAPTITFSALTVAAAMSALLVFPQRFLWSMGVGGILCALAAAAISLTLLPAVLALLGDRIDTLTPARWREAARRDARADHDNLWGRAAARAVRRPGRVALVVGIALLVAATPLLRLELTGVDASLLPATTEARLASERIDEQFPQAGSSSIGIVVAGAGDEQLRRAVDGVVAGTERPVRAATNAAVADARIEQVGTGSQALAVLDLPIAGNPNRDAARDLVAALRGGLPAQLREDAGSDARLVGVEGATAETVDTLDSLASHAWLAAAIVVGSTLVLVFLFTGSLVLPIKAVALNALTIAAALGMLVLVFQDGRLEGLLGYTSQGALEASQLILVVVIAFGLSTDYGIILLSRIREERERGASDHDAIVLGIRRTGRLVTCAALLLSIALGAFVTSQIVFIKQIGVGTVAAVMLDATIVRALLVPALMGLLGSRNWWAPAPLAALHRRIGVREVHVIGPPTSDAGELVMPLPDGAGDESRELATSARS